MMPFSDLLRDLRTKRGLSQNELAKLSDTYVANVSLAENGKRSPPMESVEKWLKFLQLSGREAERFRFAAMRARAEKHTGLGPYLEQLDARMAKLTALLAKVVAAGQKSGVDFPQSLLDQVQALVDDT